MLSQLANANEIFKFSEGDEVFISADKTYSKGGHEVIYALGNVVINVYEETLYGESATINRAKKEITIEGNVRYISKDITLYGSSFVYYVESGRFILKNARIISEDFTIVGAEILRDEKGIYHASDAEYTTCRDCPESWTLLGSKVKLILNQYIFVTHALVRIKGISVMYIPYISIPIKKKRETGLLFPLFSYQNKLGVTYRQPWFWAMTDQNDLTMTPGIWGKRGLGGDLQYRHSIGEQKWFESNFLGIQDKVYRPQKVTKEKSGTDFFRYFTDYEHHFQFGNYLTHHFKFSWSKDIEMNPDFSNYLENKMIGTELGGDGFIDFRDHYFDFNVEAHLGRNILAGRESHLARNSFANDSKYITGFDDSYVQVLPKLSLDLIPFGVVHSEIPGFKNIALGLDSSFTVFKQNKFDEPATIDNRRNAKRLSLNPFIDWYLADLGPVNLKTLIDFNYQQYDFRKKDEVHFSKRGMVLTSQLNFEVDKIMGLAYEEKLQTSRLSHDESTKKMLLKKTRTSSSDLIGEIPNYEESNTQDYVMKIRHSYRHSQQFKLLHYFTPNQTFRGNSRFRKQIKVQEKLFDYEDAERSAENEIGTNVSRTLVSTKNSVEFQWNNSLIKKIANKYDMFTDDRFLLDNFTYLKIAHFNISQGVRANLPARKLKDNLERLRLESGLSLGRWTFDLDGYYFYKNSKNNLLTNLGRIFDFGKLGVGYEYYGFSNPRRKYVTLSGEVTPVDIFKFGFSYRYDLEKRKRLISEFTGTYMPSNNCWRLELAWKDSLLEDNSSFGINVYFNISNNSFTSFKGRDDS